MTWPPSGPSPPRRNLDLENYGPAPLPPCWSSTTSACLPTDQKGAAALFHVINTRYEHGHPTLVTTNRGLPEWGEVFGDAVVASAILDRLMHNAIVFNIKGPSWRMSEHHALQTATSH